ncbi:hypothetical protein IW245_000093 [Longispora fulva]|uniref:Uncharacterized protein n=1 Tax=Longispora fulva TaxID=619741 RepID=A0A8J7G933_9ACTN|nr:hypothetical protein [Longispora fulva]
MSAHIEATHTYDPVNVRNNLEVLKRLCEEAVGFDNDDQPTWR